MAKPPRSADDNVVQMPGTSTAPAKMTAEERKERARLRKNEQQTASRHAKRGPRTPEQEAEIKARIGVGNQPFANTGSTYHQHAERVSVPRKRHVVYDKFSDMAERNGMTIDQFVATLSPEELARGQMRSKEGKWSKPSAYVPRELHQACMRELLKRGETLYREHFISAIELFAQVVASTDADTKDRMKAAQYIIERVQGKVPDKVEVSTVEPWQTMVDAIITETEDANISRATQVLRED